jgi:hypothetical protein
LERCDECALNEQPSEDLSHPDLYRRRGDSVVVGDEMRALWTSHFRARATVAKGGAAGDALSDAALSSSGTLASYATVHMHQAKTIAAPFVIGEMLLQVRRCARPWWNRTPPRCRSARGWTVVCTGCSGGERCAEARTALRVDGALA